MTFSAGKYLQAVSGQKKAAGAIQKGVSQAAGQQVRGQEFALDEQINYAKKQKDAGSIFSKWKSGAGLLAGLAAIAFSAPVLLAAGLAGGATYLGGKHGQKKAKQELDKSKFFKGQTGEMMDYMDSDVVKSSIIAAVMAGGGAHFREAAKAKELAAAGEVAKGGAETAVVAEGATAGGPKPYVDADAAASARINKVIEFDEWKELNPDKAAGGWEAYSKDVISGGAGKPIQVDTTGVFANEDNYNPLARSGFDFGEYAPPKGFSMPKGINPIENLGYAVKGGYSKGKELIGKGFGANTNMWEYIQNINTAGTIGKAAGLL